MRIAISQPRYLPALNYLQRMALADRFVLLDDVQHQRRAFEHRNRIRNAHDCRWLSIPLDRGHGSRPLIRQLRIKDPSWLDEHTALIRSYYQSAPHFDDQLVRWLYEGLETVTLLVDVIECQLVRSMQWLDIPLRHPLIRSSAFGIAQRGSRQLAGLTQQLGGSTYVSGPNGRDYVDRRDFRGSDVVYHDFEYPRYSQCGGGFIPWLAWLDHAFNLGREATRTVVLSPPLLNAA